MPEMSAERFAQRCLDADLVDVKDLEAVWSEFGTRDVAVGDFSNLLLRKELLTNFQVERIIGGKRDGFYYGNYKVLYLVGSGTFARVYRAAHRETGKVFAVKVLRQRYAGDVTTTEQFLREAKMVIPLRHPNIVPIQEVQSSRGRTFMVMEFVEGQNLRDFLKVRGRLDLQQSMRLITDVATGLDFAISKGVTHRDLKLSNVLVSSHGRAKLVDFGLAAISAEMSDDAITNAPNPRSIDYAGLERATGVRKNDPRSDIYFAGCMLYHLLAGRSPLYETRDRIQRLNISRYRDVKSITEFAPDLPYFVVALVNKCMELKPEKRIATPGELLSELNEVSRRVAAGDTGGPATGESRDQEQAASADLANVPQEGDSRTVLLVETNAQMQNLLRDTLKRRGYRVLVISDPERAMNRFSADDPGIDCVLFSTTDMEEDAVEAFNRFGTDERTQHVPAILLVEQEQHDLLRDAQLSEHRVTLSLPIKVRQLRATLLKLLSLNPQRVPNADS